MCNDGDDECHAGDGFDDECRYGNIIRITQDVFIEYLPDCENVMDR